MSQHRAPESIELREFLFRTGDGKSVCVFKKHDNIFVQGQAADSIFYIQKGRVKVVASRHGKEFIIGLFQAGQFCGESALGGASERLASVRALEECRVTSIPAALMRNAIRTCPGLAELFRAHLLKRNSRIEADSADKMLNCNEARLARLLLILANFQSDGEAAIAPVNFDQKSLAEMIGGTRSCTSMFLNKFRKLGFIDYRDGAIHVRESLWTALGGNQHRKPVSVKHHENTGAIGIVIRNDIYLAAAAACTIGTTPIRDPGRSELLAASATESGIRK